MTDIELIKEEILILVVEDSNTQAEHLKNILHNEGYRISIARNGEMALEKIQKESPDVIISDILMPVMDGYELCTRIKKDKRFKQIPVILLTALTDPQDVIRGLNAGADNFIPKPYTDTYLTSRVKYILINAKMRKKAFADFGLEIFFAGKKHLLTTEKMQIIDLLLSTYENAVSKSNELIKANQELSQLKDDLEMKNGELEKLNEEKNQFLGMAAHDLRNPLSTIYSFINLLKDKLGRSLTGEYRKFFGIIENSTEFMLKLVSELLDISKIEAGKLKLNPKKFNLIGFMEQNIETNKYLAEKKNQEIIFNADKKNIEIEADDMRLEQVMNNLLSNAIKYSEPGSRITVEVVENDDGITVAVKDEGQGIPDNERDLLFKPFTKTSAKTTGGEISTGLGLATTKKIVEAHEGRIWVESEVNRGSSFFFSLPYRIKRLEITPVKPLLTLELSSDWSDKTILLVDDIYMNYAFFKGALSKTKAKLVWVQEGKSAIEMIKNNDQIDLILMDINMPGFNGFEVTRKIREINNEVTIIGQTAYAMGGEDEKCYQAGCNDYLQMPVKPKFLLEKIDFFFKN